MNDLEISDLAKSKLELLNALSVAFDLNSVYVLIEWPDSQEYMEEDWFDEEAVLNMDLSAAYYIPISRLI